MLQDICTRAFTTKVEQRRLRLLRPLTFGLVLLSALAPRTRAQQASSLTAAGATPAFVFEVAAIKPSKPDSGNHGWDDSPGRLSVENYTLCQVVRIAYGLKSDSQVIGGPKWIRTEHFDIVAKADDAQTLAMQKMDRTELASARSMMLQSLLTDRFKLQVAHGERDRPIYALEVAKSGIKFSASPPDEKRHGYAAHNSALTATGASMDALADFLTRQFEIGDRVVDNRTDLGGDYDFKLNWTPDRGTGIPPDAVYPGLFTALEEQLGLKLTPAKGSAPVVIVVSASEPEFD